MTKDWESYWESRPAASDGSLDDALIQVGKTQFGRPVSEEQLTHLETHIRTSLNLDPTHKALDLGCGNGLLTHKLARHVRHIEARDYSSTLLQTAQSQFAAPNITYAQGDLTRPEALTPPGTHFDVAWSVEVVQNLTPESLTTLLEWLDHTLTPGGRFLASGIPDRDRIRNFYDTPERWQLHLDNLAKNQEQMGKWWAQDEITKSAKTSGLKVTFLPLPANYYTARYRFDALFTKAAA